MKYSFDERLNLILNIRGLKPVDLANKLNINRAIISQYLSGRYRPNQDRLFELAKCLEVNPVWLMGFDVPMESDIEIINEEQFNEETINNLKEYILNKISNVDKEKKKEILDQLGWELMSMAKEME